MQRKAMILFAVTLAGGTAAADPWRPRTLASGQPAAGNVFDKFSSRVQTADAAGAVRALGELLVRQGEQLGARLADLANTPAVASSSSSSSQGDKG